MCRCSCDPRRAPELSWVKRSRGGCRRGWTVENRMQATGKVYQVYQWSWHPSPGHSEAHFLMLPLTSLQGVVWAGWGSRWGREEGQ